MTSGVEESYGRQEYYSLKPISATFPLCTSHVINHCVAWYGYVHGTAVQMRQIEVLSIDVNITTISMILTSWLTLAFLLSKIAMTAAGIIA